ncbi:hypothetical protein NW765_011425 [Fusarium oxysporum]|nr:hypothetical protein NW765_011425 [Fusarium oxysporum]
MSTVKRFVASAQAHDVLQTLKADGIVVIEGAAKTATLDSALNEIGPLADGQTFGLIGKSRTFATELLMNDLFIDLTKRLLTDTCTIYYSDERTVSTAEPQVSFTSALFSKPRSSGWGFAARTIVITPFIPPNGKPILVSPMQRLTSPEITVPFELSSAPTCGKTLEIPLLLMRL